MLRRQSRDTNRSIKKVGVLPIWIVWSNVLSIGPSSERNSKGPMLEMLDYAIRIGSTPTFLYFDLSIFFCP